MEDKSASDPKKNDSDSECTICLQPVIQPVKLPCNHIFCFLCVKGLTRQNNMCALCRKIIPHNYLNNPQFVKQTARVLDNSYRWFYQGQSGWWQYDDRTHTEIEASYQNHQNECEVLIAGVLYVIDFSRNLQMQKHNSHCLRNIKRDLVTAPKKGVAGVYMRCDSLSNLDSCKATSSKSDDSCKSSAPAELNRNKEVVIVIPNNGISGLSLNLNNKGVSPAISETLPSVGNSCQPTEAGQSAIDDCTSRPEGRKRKIDDILDFTEQDLYKSLATTVVSKLQGMDKKQRLFSEKLINDVLFKGLLGKLSENSYVNESL